jgi:DNA polymerase-3 subunit alpha
VRGVQALDSMTSTVRLEMTIVVDRPEAVEHIASLMGSARGGRSALFLLTPLPDGRLARLCVGRDFRIDVEISDRIQDIDGVSDVSIEHMDTGRHLRVVGG